MSKVFAKELLEKLGEEQPLNLLLEGMNRAIECGHNFGCTNVDGAFSDFTDEVEELREELQRNPKSVKHIRNEIGDCFFSLVNICRVNNIDLDEVLYKSAERWLSRKALMEQKLIDAGYNWDNYPPEVGTAIWQEVKVELKSEEYK